MSQSIYIEKLEADKKLLVDTLTKVANRLVYITDNGKTFDEDRRVIQLAHSTLGKTTDRF